MLLGLLKALYHISSVIYKVSNVRIVCCWVSNPVKSNQSEPERGMERQPAEKVRGFQQTKTQLGDTEQAVGQLVRTRDVLTSLHHQCQSCTHTDFPQKVAFKQLFIIQQLYQSSQAGSVQRLLGDTRSRLPCAQKQRCSRIPAGSNRQTKLLHLIPEVAESRSGVNEKVSVQILQSHITIE